MKFNILTLFPDFYESPLGISIGGRARKAGKVSFQIKNIRDFATDKHKTTDDRPYGGGPGMLMKVEPIAKALQSIKSKSKNSKIILMSAKGKLFTQQKAKEYSKLDELTIICGHYEGVDERVAEHLVDEEVRVGDYVLTGGETASLVIVDAVTRLIPGVLGNDESNLDESHTQHGKLSYPQYTRPEEYEGNKVPQVLLSGDHQAVKKWRSSKSLDISQR